MSLYTSKGHLYFGGAIGLQLVLNHVAIAQNRLFSAIFAFSDAGSLFGMLTVLRGR